MIENKNQFKKAIKENRIKEIIRIYNFDKNNKVPENEKAIITHLQTNAFKLKWNCLDKETWTYFENIEVKNNTYVYYNYVGYKFSKGLIENLKLNDIELIQLTEKEKEKVNKNTNAEYEFKFVVMINKIIEV